MRAFCIHAGVFSKGTYNDDHFKHNVLNCCFVSVTIGNNRKPEDRLVLGLELPYKMKSVYDLNIEIRKMGFRETTFIY